MLCALSASGGTEKTYLINAIVDFLRSEEIYTHYWFFMKSSKVATRWPDSPPFD